MHRGFYFTAMNLIPQTVSSDFQGNYWAPLPAVPFPGNSCTPRDQCPVDPFTRALHLSEKELFSENGLYNPVLQEFRESLTVLLEDVWDLPNAGGKTSSAAPLDLCCFPSFHVPGYPEESMKKLIQKIKDSGFQGLGLEIHPPPLENFCTDHKTFSLKAFEKYWTEKAIRSARAGILFWKILWAPFSDQAEYRNLTTRLLRRYAPQTRILHTLPRKPWNPPAPDQSPEEEHRQLQIIRQCVPLCDFFLLSETPHELSRCTLFQRTGEVLREPFEPAYSEVQGFLLSETDPVPAAVLGCAVGIRNEMNPANPNALSDPGIKQALLWQRIAQPFPVFGHHAHVSEWDTVCAGRAPFPTEESCFHRIPEQTAPAVIARDCPLPEITAPANDASDPIPLLASSCFNQGRAYAIGVFSPGKIFSSSYALKTAASTRKTADVEACVPADNSQCITGIFGHFHSLTLHYRTPLNFQRVFMQDLLGTEAIDVTDRLLFPQGNTIKIPGSLLSAVCRKSLSAETAIPPEPGAILAFF